MKNALPGFIGMALLLMAGCSSKSAVSTSQDNAGQSGAGSGSGISSSSLGGSSAGSALGDVFFEFDSTAIVEEAQAQLKQNVAWMQSNAAKNVLVEGHCDERGTDEYNMALGERRAMSAKDYMVNLGVKPFRLKTVSFGEEHPFDPGHNETAWAKNRRAHFVITQ
jgi:peptidoglycan-associated lipoprotein